MSKLSVGDRAPDFALQTESGEEVALRDALARGPVVLIFYPMDDTPGCTAQLCAVRDDRSRYLGASVQVYGVNGGDASSHRRFSAKHALTAPLLIDKGLQTAAAYDAVIGLGFVKIIHRTVVGIAPDGTIAFYQRGTPPTETILKALGAAA